VGTEAVYQRLPATPGEKYSLSGLLANHRLSGANLLLSFEDASFNALNSLRDESVPTSILGGGDRGGWSYQTLTALAPETAAYVVVKVEGIAPLTSGTDGYVIFDQLRLMEGPRPLPYVVPNQTPAIFPNITVANYGTDLPFGTDSNVTSYISYDRWGRPIVQVDADGVSGVTDYAANETDVASTHDGLGNGTRFTSFDAVGNPLVTVDALGRSTTMALNLRNQVTSVTQPNGRIDTSTYNAYGQLTVATANYVDGTPSASDDGDIQTTYTYDQYGNVTSMIEDAGTGTIAARTDATYDLLGHELTRTVYPDGQSNGRTTRTYYTDWGTAAGVQQPDAPPSPAPACPNGGSALCHTRTDLDFNDRPTQTIDAYGKVRRSSLDFAGRTVLDIVNYDAGAPGTTSDTNLATEAVYDLRGNPVSVTDPIGRTTTTTYDALGRPVQVTAPDSASTTAVLTPAGRVLRSSSLGGPSEDLDDVAWTMNRYDAAGRQTHTVRNADPHAAFGSELLSFEGDTEGVTNSSPLFVSAGSSLDRDDGDGHTGAFGLSITTSASATNQGMARSLPGTFVAGRTYTAVIHAKGATSGQDWGAFLGLPTAGSYASTTAVSTGEWQTVEISWTPAVTTERGVLLGFRGNHEESAANQLVIDNVTVFDADAPAMNVASQTVFDAAGQVVTSMAEAPAHGEAPLATTTTYTDLGNPATVTTSASSARSGTEFDFLTEYAYDALGRQTTATDPAGVLTASEWDRLGRQVATVANHDLADPTGLTDTKNITARAAYNDRGELTATCAPNAVKVDGCDPTSTATGTAVYQSAWRYAYDVMGNQTLAVPPLNTTLTAVEKMASAYDATGLRRDGTCSTTSTDCVTGVSRATEFTYDDVGRLITERTMELDPLPVERARHETTFDAAGRRTGVDYFTDAAASPNDAIEFTYDAHDRLTAVERGGTTLLSGSTYNPDGTQATQTTPAGTATFSYDRRDRLTGATSPLFSGSVSYAWTNDGVLDERSWPGGASASYAYDAARRPTGMTVENGTITLADFGRSLDRVGNVTSETQTLDGVTGFAGSETQSFTYDSLRRLLTSSISDGSTSDARSYTYDAGSRRMTKTENGVTTSYAYDRNDQLVTQTIGTGSAEPFAYDAYGRLTTRPSVGGTTTYAYDFLDRLVGITAPGGEEETFSLDALGRKWTRSLDAVLTDTYTYLDASYAIVRIQRPSQTVDSAVDAIGSRIATGTSGGDFGFALPDLHGNFAAAVADDAATISDAFRYDGYGQLLDEATSNLPTPWRFQGKPLLSAAGDDLYDFESRAYDPGTGTFTQLDTFAGAVQNPLTLNRFLYAHANPTTLIDPDGHCPVCRPMIDGLRHQHAKPPKQTLSYAPPKASFRLPARPANVRSPGPAVTASVPATPRPTQSPDCAVSLNCTVRSIETWTAPQRIEYVEAIETTYGKEYGFTGYFNNIKGILDFADQRNLAKQGTWFSMVDAYILHGIQQGLSSVHSGSAAPVHTGAAGWAEFFAAARRAGSHDELRSLWGTAEQSATDYGVAQASAQGLIPTGAERDVLLGLGNVYRAAVANPDETAHLVGLTAGVSLGSATGAVGSGCTVLAPVCIAGLAVGGFTTGYLWGGIATDWIADPRNRGAHWLTAQLYDGASFLEGISR
jgi:large repetitive protein